MLSPHLHAENCLDRMVKKSLVMVVMGLTLSSPAFAAKAALHCAGKNKKEIAAGNAKACKAAGGKWVKVKTPKSK
jgi:hypothetical protein